MIKERFVEYQHAGKTFEGFLAFNDTVKSPMPAVMVSHAWAGRGDFECDKARSLAKLGYAGFALDLYGKGVLGRNNEENSALMQPLFKDRPLLQSRLTQSLACVRSIPEVDSGRIAAIGFCFGGLCVLDLARTGADIRGIASFHGLFVPPGNLAGRKIKAAVLALHGHDDPMVPVEQVVALEKELTEAGCDWQIHMYGRTMHSFTNPQANNPDFGTVYNAAADRRSWHTLVDFLEEKLR